MGILDQGVDWSGIDESSQGDFSPIPEGQYTIEGVSFEDITYTTGNQGVKIQFKIVGPTHENRRIFENFVLTGNNPNVAIGRLKSFMRGTGIDVDNVPLNSQSLSQAMNRPTQANISIEKGTGGYPDNNKVKSFLTPQVQAPVQPQPQAPMHSAPQMQAPVQPQVQAQPQQQPQAQPQQPVGNQPTNWQ